MFGSWGNPDTHACERIIARCLDSGINFVDCADVYSSGQAEEIVGRAISGRRDELILATKFHGAMGPVPNDRGASRRWIRRAVDDSLRRLNVDHIDLYQLHRPQPDCRPEETLRALDALVSSGKILMYGVSNFPAEDLVEFDWICRTSGLSRPATIQSPYSIFNRGIERGVLPAAQRLGIGTIAFGPLNGGWLTEKYQPGEPVPEGSRAERKRIPARFDFAEPGNQAKFDLLPALRKIAEQESLSLPALALSWAVEHPAISTALIGPRTLEQAEQLLDLVAQSRPLSDTALDAIDALVPPGTVLNQADNSYQEPALVDSRLRRRNRR